MPDEKAIFFKVQSLYGRHARRCGGHKREGECAIPGEISGSAARLLPSRGGRMELEKSAEAIVGGRPPLKGRMWRKEQEPNFRRGIRRRRGRKKKAVPL